MMPVKKRMTRRKRDRRMEVKYSGASARRLPGQPPGRLSTGVIQAAKKTENNA
jgi:hypothetical protein